MEGKETMRIFFGIIIMLLINGCTESHWSPHRKIETKEERACVMKEERTLLRNVPRTLSGHDQDWDDAIKAAHEAAIDTCCATRLYEWESGFNGRGSTGAVKEVGR